jgi:hypothetical protein
LTINDIPIEFRIILFEMKKLSEEKYKGYGNICVGALFFLRFFCPSILSPQNFEILFDIPNNFARRSLILIAKIIQLLANDVKLESEHFFKGLFYLFIELEKYLIPFFSLINDNREKFNDFLNNISKIDQNDYDTYINDSNYLFNNINDNLILRSLLSLQDYFFESRKKFIEEKRDVPSEFDDVYKTLIY